MHADKFKNMLEEFAPAFNCVKSLCREVQSILFPLIKDGELDLGTPADPPKLYDPFMKALKDAIVGLDADT